MSCYTKEVGIYALDFNTGQSVIAFNKRELALKKLYNFGIVLVMTVWNNVYCHVFFFLMLIQTYNFTGTLTILDKEYIYIENIYYI